jgi:hypothetical protein
MNTIREQQQKKASQTQKLGFSILAVTFVLGVAGFFIMTRNTNVKRN